MSVHLILLLKIHVWQHWTRQWLAGSQCEMELQVRLLFRRVFLNHTVTRAEKAFWLNLVLKPFPLVHQARILFLLYGPTCTGQLQLTHVIHLTRLKVLWLIYCFIVWLVPWTRTAGFGPRSFPVAGPSLWNALPSDMKLSTLTAAPFRSQLKTLMFVRSCYPSAQSSLLRLLHLRET